MSISSMCPGFMASLAQCHRTLAAERRQALAWMQWAARTKRLNRGGLASQRKLLNDVVPGRAIPWVASLVQITKQNAAIQTACSSRSIIPTLSAFLSRLLQLAAIAAFFFVAVSSQIVGGSRVDRGHRGDFPAVWTRQRDRVTSDVLHTRRADGMQTGQKPGVVRSTAAHHTNVHIEGHANAMKLTLPKRKLLVGPRPSHVQVQTSIQFIHASARACPQTLFSDHGGPRS